MGLLPVPPPHAAFVSHQRLRDERAPGENEEASDEAAPKEAAANEAAADPTTRLSPVRRCRGRPCSAGRHEADGPAARRRCIGSDPVRGPIRSDIARIRSDVAITRYQIGSNPI